MYFNTKIHGACEHYYLNNKMVAGGTTGKYKNKQQEHETLVASASSLPPTYLSPSPPLFTPIYLSLSVCLSLYHLKT